MRVLDLAAGAGGKSLALAAAMEKQGEIIACDIRGAALAELEKRGGAGRGDASSAAIYWAPPPAPAALRSGVSGCALQRLGHLAAPAGTEMAADAAKAGRTARDAGAAAAPGSGLGAEARGRLVYATCSILPSENEERVEAFLAKNPAFHRAQPDFQASPASTGTDGFYAAFLTRI